MVESGNSLEAMMSKALHKSGARPLLGLLVTVILVAAWTASSAERNDPRPNIVIFVADDHTATDSGAYGSREVRTPNIDRLAREGLLFRNAFAGSPTCMPSRAALYTGMMPLRNGAHANNLAGESQCREGIRSLPHYLKELGYRVAQAGKTHFAPKSVFPFERVDKSEVPEPGYEKAFLRLDLNTAAVDQWLSGVGKEEKFCLVVCDHSPHVIWTDKAEYDPNEITIPPNHIDTPDTRKSRARYYTDITKMDTNLGRVLGSLAKYGFAENTLFIYTSDQGAQWAFAKWGLYDQGLRVPFIVRWPGRVAAGAETSALISLIDVLPTVIELTGGKPVSELDGKSFVPVLHQPRNTHRQYIFGTHSQDGFVMNMTPMRGVRDARYKYILNLAPENEYHTHMDKATDHDGGREYWPSWLKAAESDSRAANILKRYHWRPREELYDVLLDPYEVHNLANDPAYADVKQRLERELVAWRKQQNDTRTGPTLPAK